MLTHRFICTECHRSRDISASFIINWSFDKDRWNHHQSDKIMRMYFDPTDCELYHKVPIILVNKTRKIKIKEKLCGPLRLRSNGDILYQYLMDILNNARRREY